MNESFTPCFYHPNKAAITVCERCRRPICIEDKRIFKEEESRSSYYFSGILRTKTTIKTFDFCILCNASMLKLKANSSKDSLKFLPIIGLFFLVVSFFLSKSPSNFIWIGIIGLLCVVVCLGIIASVTTNFAEANKAKSDVLHLLSSSQIQTTTSINSHLSFESQNNDFLERDSTQNTLLIPEKDDDIFSLTCYKCGYAITLQDKFCQNCGHSTHEELINFYNAVKEESKSLNL